MIVYRSIINFFRVFFKKNYDLFEIITLEGVLENSSNSRLTFSSVVWLLNVFNPKHNSSKYFIEIEDI